MVLRCWKTAVLVIILLHIQPSATEDESDSTENLIESITKNQKVNPNKNDVTDGTEDEETIEDWYDFVIVGASPTGCVLANRLTENPEWKVLLLEAGERENFFVKVPVFAAYMQSTSYNWGYLAEPQNYSCWGMKEQRCALPRGKGLGGSTLINYMMYVRGNRQDFDSWAAVGNPGWSYKDVLRYFKKSEKSFLDITNGYHGQDGPLDVRFVPYRTKMARIFLNGLQELGFPLVDYDGEQQLGASFLHANIRNGQRLTASTAYLDNVLDRPNLHILTDSRATKILIDAKTKRAYGVQFVQDKKRYTILAKKEVILSAGALQSPQLLMLSGVGPKEHLQNVGVPVIENLPVGKILYDHIYFTGLTFTTDTQNFTLHANRVLTLKMLGKYLQGDGTLTIPGGVEVIGFINTQNTSRDAVPDAELIFVNGSPAADHGSAIRRGFRLKDDVYETYRSLESGERDAFSVHLVLLHPKSRGYMELKNNNPFKWPRIYTNYLKEDDDIETLLRGVKRVLKILDTPTMKKFGVKLHNIPLPTCAREKYGTDDYWRCALRSLSTSMYHQTATCKMGPQTDPEAIVSPELQVHGISSLRVADVSIIPVTFSGHPVAIAYMIGEKLSDIIKYHWRNQTSV
ncbi:glucose dehydrogenase [FAD, quinone]-like [Armigeres subalbatus]|uniref:glucose dehydrogenase [FAD, quinone]-like n=1 Tax=Armigeres subalbatus TaxID=124917 RepID=UPI002ED66D75